MFFSPVLTGPAFGRDMRVVFLNPGSADNIGVWGLVDRFMQAAADRLGIRLEILRADRNQFIMLEKANGMARRADPPGYVVLVNEKQAGPAMIDSPAKAALFKNNRDRSSGNNLFPAVF